MAAELSALLDAVAEIVYGSFYAAADDAGSLAYLAQVFRIAQARGVHPPPASLVASSIFADRQGWGEDQDAQTLARWRHGPDAA